VVAAALAGASSVPTWRRVVAVDTTVGGESFTAGEHLVLRLSGGMLGAAADDSLAFGFGIHRCLGAGLAELEAGVILHECAKALPEVALPDVSLANPGRAAVPDWGHLLSFQAPRTVRVRKVPVRAATGRSAHGVADSQRAEVPA
jgi:cytochrome P450